MDADAARERLAAGQLALLSALVAGGAAPGGFDAARLRVQADALLAKRRGVAVRHHPWLAEALGDARYAALFAKYARAAPQGPDASGRGDASAFEAYVRESGAIALNAVPRRRWNPFRRRRDTTHDRAS